MPSLETAFRIAQPATLLHSRTSGRCSPDVSHCEGPDAPSHAQVEARRERTTGIRHKAFRSGICFLLVACAVENPELVDSVSEELDVASAAAAQPIEPSAQARSLNLPRCALSGTGCEGEFPNNLNIEEVRGDSQSLYLSVRRPSRAAPTRETPKISVVVNGKPPVSPVVDGTVADDGARAWIRIPILGLEDGELDITVQMREGERNFAIEKFGETLRFLDGPARSRDLTRAFDVRLEVLK